MSASTGDQDDRALRAAVARAYYLEDRSRVEIAEMFGISRFKVARMLTRAREEGLVRIEIHDWGLPDDVLAERLRDRLGLDRCLVIRSHGDDDAVRDQVGAAAAAMVTKTLEPGELLGVTWGRTLTATTSHFTQLPRVSIVQLTGVVAGDISSSPVEIARQTSRRAGGDVYPIFAPLFIEDAATTASLRRHPDIDKAMSLFPQVTTALVSVGSWNPTVSQVRDVMPIDALARALERGCVADIAGILIREDGTLVDPSFQARCLAITYEELRAVPRVVAIAAGGAKAEAIRAVARAGLISELVTDHALAESILADPA